jgi:mitochondrial chaperone BCS1
MMVSFGANMDTSNKKHAYMSIRLIGKDPSFMDTLLKDAQKMSSDSMVKSKKLLVVKTTKLGMWVPRFPALRSISSIILPSDDMRTLTDDITEFLNSKHWYANMGINWTRGYLLHGPPGNGKSSLIAALAGEFNMTLHMLSLASVHLTDESLQDMFTDPFVSEGPSAYLIEDIDAVFDGRTNKTSSKISFSGLINAIDGVCSTSRMSRIIFVTTNHVDRLDAALVRPGRIDMSMFVDKYTRFYPSVSEDKAKQFTENVTLAKNPVSMAKVQGYLLKFKNDSEGALQNTAILQDIDS